MWLVAALAMGTLYRWPSAFLLTKVTIAPLGLWGIRDRRWRVTVAGVLAASLLFLPMWPTYVRVLLDAQHPAGVFYSAQDIPLLMIPLWPGLLHQGGLAARFRQTSSGGTGPASPPSTSAGSAAATCGA